MDNITKYKAVIDQNEYLTNSFFSKSFLMLVFLVLISNSVIGQTTGDYRSVATGNWTTLSTWQQYNGSAWVAATSYPGQNPGTNDVSIEGGFSVTLSSTIPNSFNALLVGDNSGALDSLLISSNSSLNTLLVNILNGGIISWPNINTDLALPTAVIFLIDPGGLLDTSVPCSSNKTITIGGSIYASCNGGTGPNSFLNLMNAGGNIDYDYYQGAIDVTGFINGCSADAIYDTRGASPDRNAGSSWNNGGPLLNRWFMFTAPASGEINVTVDIGGSKGTQQRTQVALWEADGVTEVGSDWYQFNTQDVNIGALGLTPGATYYISVDSFNTGYDGTFTLCLDDAVDYDFYEGAIDVTGFINGCSADAIYDTRGASPDRNAGSSWNNGGPLLNRWFMFTAPASDQLNITVDITGTKGTNRRTQIALWEVDGITEVSSVRYLSDSEDVILRVPGLTAGNVYYISVDTFSSSYDGTFTLCLDSVFANSNDIVINEVLFDQSSTTSATNNDEFIELYNAGTVAVDLAGWQLIDGNLLVNDTDGTGNITGSTTPFTFVCSGSQVCSGSTTLQPGEYAVIWVGSQIASKDATNATFQAWLGRGASLNNSGDDMWLYDVSTTLVDYIAWGTNNAINDPPLPTIWDNTYQNTLDNTPKGQSISLTQNGVDGNASDCWEPTTSNDASVRCLGFAPTIDSDTSLRISSVGESNNGPADLSLSKIVDNVSPDQGSDITFTLTIENDGPSPARNIIVKDIIPVGFTYTHPNFSTTQGSVTFNIGTREFEWDLGTFFLNVGNTIDLTYTVTVDVCGEFTNQVEITNSSRLDPDSTPGNGF